jgi:hypothetical protein
MGVPNFVPICSIWGNDELKASEKEWFISTRISKYIKFWKLGMSKDDSYSKVMGPYVKCWESILELLSRPIPQQSFIMLEGFWPSRNWRANYEHTSILTVVDVDLEDLVIPPYYGLKSMRPSLNIIAYTSFRDLFVGHFVLVQLVDPTIYPMWMGRAKIDVVKYFLNENHRKVYVQWWVSMKKGANNDEELYHNCWLSKWKCNHIDSKQWVEISCVTFSFSARRNTIVNSIINISATHASKAKINLDAIDNNSCSL